MQFFTHASWACRLSDKLISAILLKWVDRSKSFPTKLKEIFGKISRQIHLKIYYDSKFLGKKLSEKIWQSVRESHQHHTTLLWENIFLSFSTQYNQTEYLSQKEFLFHQESLKLLIFPRNFHSRVVFAFPASKTELYAIKWNFFSVFMLPWCCWKTLLNFSLEAEFFFAVGKYFSTGTIFSCCRWKFSVLCNLFIVRKNENLAEKLGFFSSNSKSNGFF